MRQPLQQIPNMDLVEFDIAGEWVHHTIDAAAQGELLPVEAARAQPNDELLDVVCEPGTVVAASAARVRRAVGLDATSAMLDQARALVAERNLVNVEWQLGDVYRLPCHSLSWHEFAAPMGAWFCAIA